MSDTVKDNAFTRFFEKAKPETSNIADSKHSLSSKDSIDSPSSKQKTIQGIVEVTQNLISRDTPRNSYKNGKQRFSKRINLASSNTHMAVVCDLTGAVIALSFPIIPSKVFTFQSPLSVVSNCRGIVQEGQDYLRKLDIQTLAAVLITLADDYDLFRYQPSDTGAQKNAILRTISKDVLIDAAVMIEAYVNSNNATYLPKISLIFDKDIEQNGVQSRMVEWLKVCMEAIYKPDLETYEDALTIHKSISPFTHAKARKERVALNKEFRQWKKDSKDIIQALYNAQSISAKLRQFLLTIIADNNIILSDLSMLSLICEKLNQINDTRATTLASKIMSFRTRLEDTEENEFLEHKPSFSTRSPGTPVEDSEEDNEFAAPSVPSESFVQPQPQHKPMTFLEKLKAKKAAEKAASIPSVQPVQSAGGNDDAPF